MGVSEVSFGSCPSSTTLLSSFSSSTPSGPTNPAAAAAADTHRATRHRRQARKRKKSSHFASEAFGQRVSTDAHGGFFLPVYRLGDGSSCKVPSSPNVHDSGKKWRFLCISQNPGYPNAICWQRRESMVVILVDACAHYIDASRNIRKGTFVQARRKLICSTFS